MAEKKKGFGEQFMDFVFGRKALSKASEQGGKPDLATRTPPAQDTRGLQDAVKRSMETYREREAAKKAAAPKKSRKGRK